MRVDYKWAEEAMEYRDRCERAARMLSRMHGIEDNPVRKIEIEVALEILEEGK